jgi:hypothetical protein
MIRRLTAAQLACELNPREFIQLCAALDNFFANDLIKTYPRGVRFDVLEVTRTEDALVIVVDLGSGAYKKVTLKTSGTSLEAA